MASYANTDSAIRGYYEKYLGRSPQDVEVRNWQSTGKSLGEIEQGLAQHPLAQGRSGGMASVPGTLVNEGTKGLTDLANRFKDNESVAGLAVGSLADIFKTQANTGLAAQYNDTFLGSLANYQKGMEDLKKGNTMELMGAEGSIQKGLLEVQGDYAIRGKQIDSDTSRYVADRGLDATKYTADSQERQIGLQGSEDRKTNAEKYGQERLMRADARGAIRSQGARFYS